MGDKSKIEWTEATWNPVTGCSAVSPGCTHCYAAAMTRRFQSSNPRYAGLIGQNGHFNDVVKCHEDLLDWPLRHRKPMTIFVNSMSDLFHEAVPFEFIDKVFAVMALCPQHMFQVLTKRPERMAEYFTRFDLRTLRGRWAQTIDERWSDRGACTAYGLREHGVEPPPNVYLGTSTENQETLDARVGHVLDCPSAVRFVSAEPLLGPIDCKRVPSVKGYYNAIANHGEYPTHWERSGNALNWVIVGGESGAKARPMHPAWVRSIRDQCVAAGVPFFFKQWGAWVPREEVDQQTWDEAGRYALVSPDGTTRYNEAAMYAEQQDGNDGAAAMCRLSKKAAGRTLDGVEWNEYPETSGKAAVGV